MAEYIINSPTYGNKTIILDDDIYKYLIDNKIKLHLKKTEISEIYYIMFHTRMIKGKRKLLYLHRFITNCPKGMTVDHINHNPLDNRRCNLKICTMKENNRNSIKTKIHTGVCYSKEVNKYKAYINGKHLGYFNTQADVIQARLKAEEKEV